MQFSQSVSVRPYTATVNLSLENVELSAALQDEPGEQPEDLFLQLFGPEGDLGPNPTPAAVAAQLRLWADLVERLPAQASALGLASANEPRPEPGT